MHLATTKVYVLKDYALNEEKFVKRNNYILYYCDDKGEILMISNKRNDNRIVKPELYKYIEESVKRNPRK
jgi:hypothetical protein